MRKVIKVFIRFQQLIDISLTVTFWPQHFLGQGNVAFGNLWILSILMCIQNCISMSHMVEDLWQFPYFHILFSSALPYITRSGIWQVYWLDLGRYLQSTFFIPTFDTSTKFIIMHYNDNLNVTKPSLKR